MARIIWENTNVNAEKANLEHSLCSQVNSGHFKPAWETAVPAYTKWALLIFWSLEKIKSLFICGCADDY